MKRTLIIWLAMLIARMPHVARLSKRIRSANLTFVSRKKLRRLATAVYAAKTLAPAGSFIEAGVALGGTAILIAKGKERERQLFLYDVFGMIPPPGVNDSADAAIRYDVIATGQATGVGGETYYGYQSDLKSKVVGNLRKFDVDLTAENVTLVEGVFEKTLHLDGPVAFAHIDCDWYDSVMVCIDRIWPHMASGGIMLFDDYRSYEGCKLAVDTFLEKSTDSDVIFSDVSLAIMKR